MSRHTRVLATLATSVVLALTLACQCGWLVPWPPADPLCAEAPYSPPPGGLDEADLGGMWETRYGSRVDTLTLRRDGRFSQVYVDPTERDYVYQTPWNEWWMERFPDGRVRIHLQGARYYVRGVGIGELDGYTYPGSSDDPDSSGSEGALPWLFYDAFAHEHVEMVGELLLNVRMDSNGELLLHHMSYSSDGGFAMSGCQQDQFRRIETR